MLRPARRGLCAAAVALAAGCGAPAAAPAAPAAQARRACEGLAVAQIAIGDTFACARCDSGRVECWGDGTYGQLADGESGELEREVASRHDFEPSLTVRSHERREPRLAIEGAIDVAAGLRHACAVRADGTVACWGRGESGELGNGRMLSRSLPVEVVGLADAIDVEACATTCAIVRGGRVRCWGWNATGGVGDGTDENRSAPVDVVGVEDASAIAIGGNFACALRSGGRVSCWGGNHDGQLGDPSFTEPVSLVPRDVPGLAGIAGLAAGGGHTCAWDADGALYCWGARGHGQLGPGEGGMRRVVGIPPVVAARSVELFTYARTRDGRTLRWGGTNMASIDRSALPPDETVPHEVQPIAADVATALGGRYLSLRACATFGTDVFCLTD
jgi:alpha-tubulin suppressor-like RCC1 family protein